MREAKEVFVVKDGEHIVGIYTNEDAAQDCIDRDPDNRSLEGPYSLERVYDEKNDVLVEHETELLDDEDDDEYDGFRVDEEGILDFGGDEPEDPYGD